MRSLQQLITLPTAYLAQHGHVPDIKLQYDLDTGEDCPSEVTEDSSEGW